ncbi:succinate dehydrogenase / fumarate reductase cytochrome b subunit [Reichenbachiella faecimaris]|uniref:Succinate dehydrogenase / fumarate reductase cytochrome b subunit n=1 Tax=Reichenbachiella faecimaris TaxID=692418 RepID=A0A1W2GPQ3_REIFA|nr:succinate dehydrogenase cytochrome b subunit [Reichenbachiella faecimaris]SMD38660.1 succinate dehydrogenase / fumarate reductase cytochrome b subunit [Reichenbachiella faecimaris]
MSWFTQTLSGSVGKKLLMALTGLFLILFLVIHLAGNLQLLFGTDGEAFNIYAHNMANNPFIKVVSYGNFFFIIVHVIDGIILTMKNKAARNVRYKVPTKDSKSSWASKNMALLGIITLIFLIAHLKGFWYEFKGETIEEVTYGALTILDGYAIVDFTFSNPLIVGFYVICMIFLGFHLSHGFSSAFQSMGLNHKKYTPFISKLGLLYSILIPFGFAIIPILMYLNISF